MADRRVHARLRSGSEIVRYDRAGKWFIEYASFGRDPITFDEAVEFGCRPDSQVYFGQPGGSRFDAAVREGTRDGA